MNNQTADHLDARRAAARRRRGIILNNDGNEPVYLIKEPTADEILAYRTAPFVGSQVDTVFYCTWSSGFGLFTHFTEAGQMFTTTEGRFAGNKMNDLVEAGVDPLRVMNDFCHGHDIEFFWSMRMNDTHDGHGADYSPTMLRANDLKTAHPEYMIATAEAPPRYGNWTAMDFAYDEVRELVFLYVQEVCRNYNVDGVELDFFRHPVYFRDPSRGFACSEHERDLMTDLVRRIRGMMDEEGRKRGRPILLAVKTPDHVGYCRNIGLDIERWLAADLIDLYIPSGYIRLNPWEYSVALGHRYGVPVYPSLDESRVKETGVQDVNTGSFTNPRGVPETYRARAAEVWASGADGVYLYNYFNPKSPILREMGQTATLAGIDKHYFSSYRGVARIAGDGFPHESYINLPTLNPQHPLSIYGTTTESTSFRIHEDLGSGRIPGSGTNADGREPEVTVRLLLDGNPSAEELRVTLNALELDRRGAADLWTDYGCPASVLRDGPNLLAVTNLTNRRILLNDAQVVVRYGS